MVAGGCRWLLRGYEWIQVVAYNCGVAAVLKVITGGSKWQVAAGNAEGRPGCVVAGGYRWLQRGCRVAGGCSGATSGYRWLRIAAEWLRC